MPWKAYINYQNVRETIEVDGEEDYYKAQVKACLAYLKLHPSNRPHDDKRRPYPIPVRPYWLINCGYVHLQRSNDRRIKY